MRRDGQPERAAASLQKRLLAAKTDFLKRFQTIRHEGWTDDLQSLYACIGQTYDLLRSDGLQPGICTESRLKCN